MRGRAVDLQGFQPLTEVCVSHVSHVLYVLCFLCSSRLEDTFFVVSNASTDARKGMCGAHFWGSCSWR